MNAITKRLKSKTYWYGAAVVALGFAEQYGHVVTQFIPEQYKGLAVSLLGVGVWVLREMTKSPVAEK